jgi:LacI family transcriptional regulator
MTKRNFNSVTIREVARLAGVSVATVSRLINHTVPVSEEVAVRVQAAMAELKFIPHAAARRLATQKTNTLGLLLTDMSGDFFGPLLTGIENVTGEAGFDLLVSSSRQPGLRKEFPVGPHNTDGVLIFADGLSETGLDRLYGLGFPMVLIHRSPPDGMNIPCVTVENKAASRKIVEHLIEMHGRRRIVFLSGPLKQEDSYWRELGYRQALETYNLPFDPALIAPGEFDRVVASASLHGLLSAGVAMDAVFAGDDEAAVGVLSALREAGKRVPEDVAVVGFDDQRLAAYLTPPLTTVRAPTEEVGRIAAQQLLRLIQTGQAESLIFLPTEILIRSSCGCKSEERYSFQPVF